MTHFQSKCQTFLLATRAQARDDRAKRPCSNPSLLAPTVGDAPSILFLLMGCSLKINETINMILDFMDLEHVGILQDFQARSDYKSYFTDKQEVEIGNLIQDVASEKSWRQVKRYFG
jgi:hypothetical protein